jgi:hypothetical protein
MRGAPSDRYGALNRRVPNKRDLRLSGINRLRHIALAMHFRVGRPAEGRVIIAPRSIRKPRPHCHG